MKIKFAYTALLFIALLTSCSEQDYYDPNSQVIPDELSDLTVPSGFDWTTSSNISVNLDVNDQYDGLYYYQLEVFNQNPIISPNASLLAKGLAKKNEPFKAKVTYAKSDSILYVQETDPTGKRSVRALYTSNALKSASVATLKSGSTKSLDINYTAPTRTYTTPSNATVISGASYNISYSSNQYVIPAGQTFEGQINNGSWYDAYVYVEGTWKNTSTNTELNNLKIIIQDGGKYIPTQTSSNIKANGSAKIVVATTGQFNPDKKEVNVDMNNENGQIVNNSTVFNINNISNIRSLFNYGTMSSSGTLSANTSNVQVVNESSLTVQNLSINNNANLINKGQFTVNGNTFLQNSIINNNAAFTTQNITVNDATIENGCKFIIADKGTFQGTTLNTAAETLLISNILDLQSNNKINLGSHAIMNVTNELKFSNTGTSINGPASGNKALVKLEKFSITEWRHPAFTGYLEIESSNYPANSGSTGYDVPSDTKYVNFVRKGESTVDIEATSCNEGGNVVQRGGPGIITYPISATLGTTYTYAFEDNYPSIGDYDMNDFVLDIDLGFTLSAANKVSKIDIQSKVRAVGATKRLAAAIQLDGVLKGNIKSITNSNTSFSGDVFSMSNGLENDQDYAVIPLTDNAHALFGATTSQIINTKAGENHLPAKDITISILFNDPIDISTVSLIDMLNVFIVNGGYNTSNRKEVHLRNYAATKKSTDVSSGRNYSTSDLVYGIRVPLSFKYPLEWVRIIDAYPQFKSWVSSNGLNYPNWYQAYETNKVYLLEQ